MSKKVIRFKTRKELLDEGFIESDIGILHPDDDMPVYIIKDMYHLLGKVVCIEETPNNEFEKNAYYVQTKHGKKVYSLPDNFYHELDPNDYPEFLL
jgi:hypothetical protein